MLQCLLQSNQIIQYLFLNGFGTLGFFAQNAGSNFSGGFQLPSPGEVTQTLGRKSRKRVNNKAVQSQRVTCFCLFKGFVWIYIPPSCDLLVLNRITQKKPPFDILDVSIHMGHLTVSQLKELYTFPKDSEVVE